MKKLFIIDISNFIFRAFYAIRPLSAPDKTPVNAVYGVWQMLYKLLDEYKPTHVFVARDTKRKTFRQDIYPEYKANRTSPPEELKPQFPLVFELVEKMHLPMFGLDNYEADDLIGSAVTQWRDYFDEVVIVSSDKDLMQFIDDKVKQLDTMKNQFYDRKDVFEKMGIWPEQVVDYLSLVGDSSDNIPGVAGIGAKGAAKLLAQYSSLENIIANIPNLPSAKVKNALTEHLDDAILSKKLVSIEVQASLGHRPEETQYLFKCDDALVGYMRHLGFNSAIAKLEELQRKLPAEVLSSLPASQSPSPENSMTTLTDENYSEWADKISKASILSLVLTFDSENILSRELKTLFLANEDFSLNCATDPERFTHRNELFKQLVSNPEQQIITPHAKRIHSYAERLGILVHAQLWDVVQMHYLLHPEEGHSIDALCSRYIGRDWPKEQADENQFLPSDRPLAQFLFELYKVFSKDILLHELQSVYLDIDAKLFRVLASMENLGVQINVEYLKKLELEFSAELKSIEEDIHQSTQMDTNLKSPKQVAHLLFEKLQLPVIKKNKTGPSTDSEVLETLAGLGQSPIPAKILRYREIDKLCSTYISVLPGLVHEKSQRVHTNFSQHTAATGRLSSLHPNLQNIPIRTVDGRKIRKAFVAAPGTVLLSADYSQVELRILAHFSQDPTMMKAFLGGLDIHTQTASEIMDVPLEKVAKSDRNMAKTVNFGLMYGQSSFGLAATLSISRTEARDYITKYFNRFGQVKAYLDSLKEFAEVHGYVVTLHGRKRFLPEIKSTNRMIKSQAERVAINSPIQGTAADIIKLAMIRIDDELRLHHLKTRMLLQVHDELIFEVPASELEQVKSLVKNAMETAVTLRVPLTVDLGVGLNWQDLE
ncbi:MAG: DNA polymerase I [Bdellovibrionales bacterium GWA2_49_15]|nr:MAG: DNA polymerase I [Bdellovibrionales bacterium GWA2_49_15]HAZ11652.1 DNA polymerase I [Bdellovibrionales bacterium]